MTEQLRPLSGFPAIAYGTLSYLGLTVGGVAFGVWGIDVFVSSGPIDFGAGGSTALLVAVVGAIVGQTSYLLMTRRAKVEAEAGYRTLPRKFTYGIKTMLWDDPNLRYLGPFSKNGESDDRSAQTVETTPTSSRVTASGPELVWLWVVAVFPPFAFTFFIIPLGMILTWPLIICICIALVMLANRKRPEGTKTLAGSAWWSLLLPPAGPLVLLWRRGAWAAFGVCFAYWAFVFWIGVPKIVDLIRYGEAGVV